MMRVVPIAVYRQGIRYVVAEAMVDVPDDTDMRDLEVNITEPQLTKIQASTEGFTMPKEQ